MPDRPASSRRRIVGLLLLLLAFAAALLAYAAASGWFSGGRGGPAEESIAPSEPAPPGAPSAVTPPTPIPAGIGSHIGERAPDFALRSLDGQTFSLSQFRGRVVILDFWASWCAPCRATMPDVYALWRDVADRGVDFIGVSLDRTAAAASSYLAASHYEGMIALWGSFAEAQEVATLYGTKTIPRTVVIDRNGIVRFNNTPTVLGRALLDAIP